MVFKNIQMGVPNLMRMGGGGGGVFFASIPQPHVAIILTPFKI